MAHIKKKVTADGKVTYEVRHRVSGGKEKSRTFKKSAEAKAFKVWVEASRYQGGFVDHRAGLISVGQFSKEVLESKTNLTEKSYWGYERSLRLHLFEDSRRKVAGRFDRMVGDAPAQAQEDSQ